MSDFEFKACIVLMIVFIGIVLFIAKGVCIWF